MGRIAISEPLGIYLAARGLPGEAALATTFRAALLSVPDRYADRILQHWREGREYLAEVPVPFIALALERDKPPGHANGLAWVGHNGRLLGFCAVATPRMPACVLADVIAHELAHCWQFAMRLSFGSYGEREEHADQLALHWGFGLSWERWGRGEAFDGPLRYELGEAELARGRQPGGRYDRSKVLQ